MKKTFLIFFILFAVAKAQYTSNDSALVSTTFQRKFNKNIIIKYLYSNNSDSIKAALLTISHSEDTTFIDSIFKIDLEKYRDHVLFTLGQLGESKKASEYLLHRLKQNNPLKSKELYAAFGKCGDSTDFNEFCELLDSNKLLISAELPLAIMNFSSRGMIHPNAISILLSNLHKCEQSYRVTIKTAYFNTFYVLYRLSPSRKVIPEITKFLGSNLYLVSKTFALGTLHKLKYFPNDISLLSKLIKSESWKIRTETVNSACYFPFTNKTEIDLYLSLFHDDNPNVARSVAMSLKNISYSEIDTDWLQSKLDKLLKNEKLAPDVRGELFISYSLLFGISVEDIIDRYEELADEKYTYKLMALNPSDWKYNYSYLLDKIPESSEVELLDLLPAYLALQDKYFYREEYAKYLFTIFKGNMLSSISIIADGLTELFISRHKGLLQETIFNQIFENKNNPQFTETIFSLVKLAYKVDQVFYHNIIDILSTSDLYSVKKYALSKRGVSEGYHKDEQLFRKLWGYAFDYKLAEVTTTKGKFTIQLTPQYAPITCGNFVFLAQKGFYNGVKFHRVVPNFVIQTGDTTKTGWGGPGYEITSEFSPIPFTRGSVGIANIGKDTEGSQWFIMHSYFPHLNGHYTNWATVIKGLEVIDTISETDKIIKIVLFN